MYSLKKLTSLHFYMHTHEHFNCHRKNWPPHFGLLCSELFASRSSRRCWASAISKDETFVPPVEERSSLAICGTQEARHHNPHAGSSCVPRWRGGSRKGAVVRAAQRPRSRAQQDTLPAEAIHPILPRRISKLPRQHSKSDNQSKITGLNSRRPNRKNTTSLGSLCIVVIIAHGSSSFIVIDVTVVMLIDVRLHQTPRAELRRLIKIHWELQL